MSETNEAAVEDIVVTARLRGEESLQVPVVINAFSGEQLARVGVNTMSDLARLTPQLSSEANVGAFGGFSSMRGITSPTSNVAVDPAVLIVINNVPVGTGGATRLGQFDLGQAEILKGPQALFFGKNATGGIISLTSATPTNKFEVMVSGEYEFGAEEKQVNAVISGPISETLLGRLAFRGVDQSGFLRNNVASSLTRRGPKTEEIGVRGTLMFEPSPVFRAKLIGTYNKLKDNAFFTNVERTFCPQGGRPSGAAVVPGDTDCSLNGRFTRADLPLNLGTATNSPTIPNDGQQYSKYRQILTSLDMTYDLSDAIALTSITGYYALNTTYADSQTSGLPTLVASGHSGRNIFSEELRVASSDTEAPFTWMMGGFYQSDRLHDREHVVSYNVATQTPTTLGRSDWRVNGSTISAFAQASLKLAEAITFSGGARYTRETKTQPSIFVGGFDRTNRFIPKRRFTDVSPEATLSYQPSRDLNLYGSYKTGYKSGSYQVGSLTFNGALAGPGIINNSYNPESVQGFEIGLKSALLDRSLRFEIAAYSYLYSDLQLSLLDPATAINRISNAAKARVKGVEGSFRYAPPGLPGLRLFTTISYNRSRYQEFLGGCYTGQTIAQGCTVDSADADTRPDLQNFAGRPLFKAPEWAGNAGFTYSQDVGDLKLGINAQGLFQSKSFLAQEEAPWGIRRSKVLLDGGISVGSSSESWELALIGKNLLNERYPLHGTQVFATGVGATTGTTVGIPSDYSVTAARGREVRLRLTLRPTNF